LAFFKKGWAVFWQLQKAIAEFGKENYIENAALLPK
jgi:hypothetical protein